MVYQFDSRVRYSEVDVKQNLTLNGVINYFQDCSTFQSEELGLGIEYLKESHRAWLLSAWQIMIERLPKFGERITVQTWASGFKAFYGDRNFMLLDERGNRIVSANSLWIFIDTETGRPVKPDEEQLRKYGTEEKLELCRTSRKIVLPEEMEERGKFSVLRHQIDTNHHVNNGQYVQMAEEFLPEGFQIRQMRAEYKKAAMLHDVIVPMACHQDGVCTVALCDKEKRPYASVEFTSFV
ncbi:MAG: acyl-[acyl-carrier-protein] thioesterase [Lachnospiraceae bacterium]|nr:acyl-[acyl-carrier-protein] thioesterase [Lachnospiraceae bacterium]